jgi:predicted amidohydrolase
MRTAILLTAGGLLIAACHWLDARPRSLPAAGPPDGRPQTVKVAAVQCSSDLGAVAANRKKLTALVREAAANGAKIVVLPETAVTGYLSQDLQTNWHLKGRPLDERFVGRDPTPDAEAVPGPSTDHFGKLAGELGVYVTVPLLEVDRSDPKEPKFFNTVCLATPKGELGAHYRKLTPWPLPEDAWATPGDRGVQTYDTEYGRVGLAICFDIHTILEKYRPHKIWALLYPIAWVDESHPADWFWHRLPERVRPFGHYVVGANWSIDNRDLARRRGRPWYGYGFSTVLGPGGEVLATAKSLYGPEIVYATLKTAWARE